MNWFVFCYWFEPDAPRDPVGLVRIWTMAEALMRAGDRVTLFPPRYRSSLVPRSATVRPIPLIPCRLIRPFSYIVLSFLRQPMGASDFSRAHYSYADTPAGEADSAHAQGPLLVVFVADA